MTRILVFILAFSVVLMAIGGLVTGDVESGASNLVTGVPVLGDFLDGGDLLKNPAQTMMILAVAELLGSFLRSAYTFLYKLIEEALLVLAASFIVTYILPGMFGAAVVAQWSVFISLAIFFLAYHVEGAAGFVGGIFKKIILYVAFRALFGG